MRKTAMAILFSLCLSITPAAVGAPQITALPGQIDPHRTRSELLMDASAYIGALTPEQAAVIWAAGLEKRSAAMQYVVMSGKLKSEYTKQLDALNSNWVTGVSSPWVESFAITRTKRPTAATAEIGLRFETMTSAGASGSYGARLWLAHEDGFWRIERINADEELYAYTLYKP